MWRARALAAVICCACGSRDAAILCGGSGGPQAWTGPLGPGGRLSLEDGWQLQSSAAVTAPPSVVSSVAFAPAGWYPAHVPSTVAGTLVADGLYGDPFVGVNLRTLPGMEYRVGDDFSWTEIPPDSPFAVPWWYRIEFDLPKEAAGGKIWLTLDGVTYRADVWLNGQQVATSGDVVGAYRSFELDVTCAAMPGITNVLAIEVSAPRVEDLAHTWVDWNPSPPDKNMGLWREAWVSLSGPVAIRNPQIRTRLDRHSLDVAHLEISAELRNATSTPFSGTLRGAIERITFEAKVNVPAGSSRIVTFAAPAYPQLDVERPALWWPAQYGPQNLHTLTLELTSADRISDRSSVRFGMREVTSELTVEGSRVFSVNGKRILVRGAGWARDMFFMETPDRETREMSLVRDMGLNAIRFEGKFGSEHLLDLADELGIFVIPGWSCCDSWEDTSKWGPEQYAVAGSSMRSMALQLRNRPSVLAWLYGSDLLPSEDVESMYLSALADTHWPNPALASAAGGETPGGGPTGVKMRGPYTWVPPNYWLLDVEHGGAFGFATEISPGPAVPEVDSLRKMLGEDHLWPIDQVWNLHAGSVGFTDIDAFTAALNGRYGTATDVVDYARKAQAMTYEAERAMFEAYGQRKYRTTGVVQWMLNNAWPGLIWHLYDYYLAAGGGYYGTKKALEPLHAQYAYDDGTVVVVNSTLSPRAGLSVRAQVLDFDLTERYATEATLDSAPDSSTVVLTLPDVPALSPTYFVRLELRDAAGTVLSTNFYWLSTSPDVSNFAQSDNFQTPALAYADLTALENLPPVTLGIAAVGASIAGEEVVTATVTNPTATLAFMVRLKLTHGNDGAEILPTRWDDNFFSLLPRETRTVVGRYLPKDTGGATPVIEVGGWNVAH